MNAFADAWYRIAIVHYWHLFPLQALAILAEEYRALITDEGGRQ